MPRNAPWTPMSVIWQPGFEAIFGQDGSRREQ